MNAVIEKVGAIVRNIKRDKLKRACLVVFLAILIAPIGLGIVKFMADAMICIIIEDFGKIFIISAIKSSIFVAIQVIILTMILYLVNIIKTQEYMPPFYSLHLDDDGRILAVSMGEYSSNIYPKVSNIPDNISDYLFINGKFVYDPLPEVTDVPIEKENVEE